MASYLIANYEVTNPEGLESYVAAVIPTIVAHGGKVLVAGPGSTTKEGNPKPMTVVLQFPSRESLDGWYDSEEYQKIIHLRTNNSEGFVVFSDEFEMPG